MTALMFLPVVIIALTQIVKEVFPDRIHGVATIVIAFVMAILTSIFSELLGLPPISMAESIVGALGAIGITTALSKVNTKPE